MIIRNTSEINNPTNKELSLEGQQVASNRYAYLFHQNDWQSEKKLIFISIILIILLTPSLFTYTNGVINFSRGGENGSKFFTLLTLIGLGSVWIGDRFLFKREISSTVVDKKIEYVLVRFFPTKYSKKYIIMLSEKNIQLKVDSRMYHSVTVGDGVHCTYGLFFKKVFFLTLYSFKPTIQRSSIDMREDELIELRKNGVTHTIFGQVSLNSIPILSLGIGILIMCIIAFIFFAIYV